MRTQPCADGGTVRVTGDFLLTLWEWDAIVESNGERTLLESGHGRSSFDPVGSPETRGVVSHARHQYLYVTGGVLEFPAWTGLEAYVHSDAAIASDGTQTFHDASGTIGTGGLRQALVADTLTTHGRLAFAFGAPSVGQPLQITATGTIDDAEADGQSFALATVAAQQAVPTPLLWAGAIALLAVAAVAIALRSSRPWRSRRSLERAMDLTEAEDYGAALRWTTKAAKLRAGDPHAVALRALVLARLDRFPEALEAHAQAHRLLLPTGKSGLLSYNAVNAAAAALADGDEAAAVEWLGQALKADPTRFYADLMRPEFAGLRTHAVHLHHGEGYA